MMDLPKSELFERHGELVRLVNEFRMLRVGDRRNDKSAIIALNQRMIDISVQAVAESPEEQTERVLWCCKECWACAHVGPFYTNGDVWPRNFTELVLIAALNLKKREENTGEKIDKSNSFTDVLVAHLRWHFDECLEFMGR